MERARAGGVQPLRGGATRWPLVALAGLFALVVLGSWLPSRAAGQGITAQGPSSCPSRVADVAFPARPGRDRLLLPAGYQVLAPVTATWCRYGDDGTLTGAARLDAARTARLAALLVAPPGGWPDDALAAKEIRPLTDAELAAVAAPECAASSAADLLVFTYGQGPNAAVLVRGRPCGDATNGVITVRVPAGLATALSGS